MKRRGFTIIEVAMAAAIIGIVVSAFALFQVATVKSNQRDRDRAFALQKVTQMMEELKAKVAGNASTALDDYGQADTTYSWILTTDDTVKVPDAPLSDNVVENKSYRFARQIWVRPLPRDKGARQVTIKLFRADSTNKTTATVKANVVPLAVLTNVFKSAPIVVVPTQQYDVYTINCDENFLGRKEGCAYPWASSSVSYINSAGTYLANATSGLSIIQRSITKTSYGRDTYYAPTQNDHDFWEHYYNNAKGADLWNPGIASFDNVYFRPGIRDWWNVLAPGGAQLAYWETPTATAEPTTATQYRVPHGNTLINATVVPYNSNTYFAQPNYTYADQYNHALRYQDNIDKQIARGPSYGASATMVTGDKYTYSKFSGDTTELTLRGFLDELLEGKRMNPIIVNAHGQLFPFIPMRNYSDAAKVPANDDDLVALKNTWGVTAASASEAKDGSHCRVVTHPRSLEYDQNEVVELRTFAYIADEKYLNTLYTSGTSEPPTPYRNVTIVLRKMRDKLATWNGGNIADNVEVQMIREAKGSLSFGGPSGDWDDFNNFDISKMKGTLDPASYVSGWSMQMDTYRWMRACPTGNSLMPTDSPAVSKGKGKGKGKGLPIPYNAGADAEASVTVQTGDNAAAGLYDGDIIVKLTGVRYTPDVLSGKQNGSDCRYGLDKSRTLYGMNYFPDPLLPDLSDGWDPSDKHPRNSCRYRILFKTKVPGAVEVLTTLGDDPSMLHHQAPNISRTWAWVGVDAPDTERYQLIGDPRHNPYADVRDEERYNRFFGDLDDAYFTEDGDTDWNYFANTSAGWGPNNGGKGRIDCDIPRYFAIWRKALFRTNAMLATPNGDAFQVVGLGGDYGHWGNDDVKHSKQPMTGETNKLAVYDEWKNPTLVCAKDKKWVTKPWLGELYPDDEWKKWRDGGNLPSSDYRHMDYDVIDAFKSEFPAGTFKHTRYLDEWGPMAFYNSEKRFLYKKSVGGSTIVGAGLPNPTDGKAVSADMKALLREVCQTNRSFVLDDTSASTPSDWDYPPIKGDRTKIEGALVGTTNTYYYKAPDGNGAVAPFVVRQGNQAFYNLAFTPWNAWSGGNDPYSIMRVFTASALQGYLDMASPKFVSDSKDKKAARVRLLPRLKITKPEDDALVTGASLRIEWTPEWMRWDTKPYSRLYANYGLDGDQPSLAYVVKYSENGTSWRFVDGAGANVGAAARFPDVAKTPARVTTNPFIDLNVAGFKNKQYQIRIEAWRTDPGYETVHHAYSQFAINYTK